MRLADDRRARVPFAIVGALLLLSSTAIAASLSTSGPVRESHAVDEAIDRSTASARTALRSAVSDAARDAAETPVTAPANTTAGRVLNESEPFRDALRLRVYVTARKRLRATRHRRSDVTAAVSLPETPNASALRRAKRQVRIESVDDGTALSVRVHGLTVETRRDGRLRTSDSLSMVVTVPTPVLALHERTTEFERRLNRGPLEGSGLGRRLTARLYPVVWARGYAQYGGAPVDNVLANRHVALTTNGGVLAVQRNSFGRSDPDGRAAMRRATLRVGASDLLAPSDYTDPSWADYVLPAPNDGADARPVDGPDETSVGGPDSHAADGTLPRGVPAVADRTDRNVTVSVNRTADAAFLELRRGVGPENTSLATVARDGYSGEVRLRTAVRARASEARPAAESPGPEWRLVDERLSSSASVAQIDPGSAPAVTLAPDERQFARFARRVVLERTITRTWERENGTTTTRRRWTEQYDVGVAVAGAHRPERAAPSRPVRPLFERGGALDGPNMRDVRNRSHELVEANSGRDAVARKAALGSLRDVSTVDVGRRPSGLTRWVYADVARLRDRVRNVSVSVRTTEVAAGDANPPSRLASTLRDRRSSLVDAPETYDGAADRVRVAARTAYLDRVLERLDRRAERTRRTNDRLADALEDAGAGGRARVRRVLESRTNVSPPARREGTGRSGLGGRDAFVPDAAPTYLTVSQIDGERLASVPDGTRYAALASRNTNLFTVPYGDAADEVVEAVGTDTRRVELRTAGHALVAANRTLAATSDSELQRRRGELRRAVDDGLKPVRRRARTAIGRETALSTLERRAAVASALGRWDGAGRRALAASNGSFAAAAATETINRAGSDDVRPDRVRSALRVAVGEAVQSDAARVPETATNRTATRTRNLGERALKEALDEAGNRGVRAIQERWLNDSLGAVPAGLPVAPVPGYWYATVNVWTVRVRGQYASFSVQTRRGGVRTGGPVRYVRDGAPVELDVDGDGERERLGRSERISFETRTTVVVAVPPNGNGVGDVDGNADERSDGWARPGCAGRPTCGFDGPMHPVVYGNRSR